jgi:hypothetical protein
VLSGMNHRRFSVRTSSFSLQSLSEKRGRNGEAAFYASLANQVKRAEGKEHISRRYSRHSNFVPGFEPSPGGAIMVQRCQLLAPKNYKFQGIGGQRIGQVQTIALGGFLLYQVEVLGLADPVTLDAERGGSPM